MYFRYLWDPAFITFAFLWTVLIIKIFHQTIIFFNEVLFTSYCCVRYFHKRQNNTLYFPWVSLLSFFFAKRCLLGQTKQKGTLLTILPPPPDIPTPLLIIFYTNFQPPSCFLEPPPPPFIRELRVYVMFYMSSNSLFIVWSPSYCSQRNRAINTFL